MKTIQSLFLLTFLPICIATAGDDEQKDWMREAIAKERSRAKENVTQHTDTKRFEEKYGWAKEKHPEHFAAVMTANKKAAEAWSAVLRAGESATNPDVLSEPKQIASAESANAYLAEMTLKYAAGAAERKGMMEKTRDRDVAGLVSKIDANEKAQLLASRSKNEAQAAFEKLYFENHALNKELRTAYDKSRKKETDSRSSDRDKERHAKEHKKDHGEQNKEPDGGGGVLGR
jgi:hypothetical protein